MLKIEYDGESGKFKLEGYHKGNAGVIADFVGLLHEFYVNQLNNNPKLAKEFKEGFMDCVNAGIIFEDNETANKNMNKAMEKQRDEMKDYLLKKLETLDDMIKSLAKEKKTTKTTNKTKKA